MEIKLRPWTLEDLDDLVKYADNANIARNMMDLFPHPYQVDHGLAFIQMTMNNTPPNILAIEIDGKACGSIGLHLQQDVFRKNAELGYWLAEPLWGKGIMPQAIRQMVTYGFSKWEINRIFARPFGTNHRSQKVLEKAGFTLEAKLAQTVFKNGMYHDELIYSVRRPHTPAQQDETYTSPGF